VTVKDGCGSDKCSRLDCDDEGDDDSVVVVGVGVGLVLVLVLMLFDESVEAIDDADD
jgi:hypothetical protein